MIVQYIQKAMEKAHYEIIDDDEPYYGEIPACPGVWATGKTLEECRRNLEGALEGWIIVRLQRLTIPNPHRREIGPDLLARILRQAGVSRRDWERAK
jgi:predicted RNase H-like HicB family nuclease